ncbi:MAG: transglycosylase SLT domain-containing protein [Spirochaetales bacterium]|jgi:soluble lytic murein transglycosylase|nr:transglycosylase SLT domain-containing protein [Spirochaetales bacterium]
MFLIINISCGPQTIWDIPVDDLHRFIESGDTSFLHDLNTEESDLGEIIELGPGAAYFLAFVSMDIGREDLYPLLLEQEIENADRRWTLLAGNELVRHWISLKEYMKAERIALQMIEKAPDDGNVRKLYIESLYWQKRDLEVLEKLPELMTADMDTIELSELSLFQAVSSSRVQIPGWEQLFVELFTKNPLSAIHHRGWGYIRQEKAGSFSTDELEYFRAAAALADRKYDTAVPVFARLLRKNPEKFLTQSTLRSAYDAYRRSEIYAEGADLFEELLGLEGIRSDKAIEYELFRDAGILNRRAGRWTRSLPFFENALSLADNENSRDEMLWFLFDTTRDISVDAAIDMIPKVLTEMSDPEYFTDAFEEIITTLVQQREWDRILKLYTQTAGLTAPYIEARLAYICGAALREGFLDTAAARVAFSGPDDGEAFARIFFGYSMIEDAGRYYEIVASQALNILPVSLSIVDPPDIAGAEAGDIEQLVSSYLAYGLVERAYETAYQAKDEIRDHVFVNLASDLYDSGDVINSIRIMSVLQDRFSFYTTRENLELIFPRGFRNEIEAAAEKNNIPPYLLFALVRTESAFTADIRSSAGAVGLTQLMPATAAEMAGRMRIDLPPLNDPAANVDIGAYYLRYLIDRYNRVSHAVFAYNAGPGRMNSWRERYLGLPQDLLLEAVPFTETRYYGRRVLAYASIYGYLYYGLQPGAIVHRFFTEEPEGTDTE